MSKGVKWKMQGAEFVSNMLVVSIGGVDVVLGIKWLVTLNDVSWNFKQLKCSSW